MFSDYAGLDIMSPSVLPLAPSIAKKHRKCSTITLEKKAGILKQIESGRTQTER